MTTSTLLVTVECRVEGDEAYARERLMVDRSFINLNFSSFGREGSCVVNAKRVVSVRRSGRGRSAGRRTRT